MSNDQDPDSLDPRYDGIYQRGGSTGTDLQGGSGAWTSEAEPSGAARPQSAGCSASSHMSSSPRSSSPRPSSSFASEQVASRSEQAISRSAEPQAAGPASPYEEPLSAQPSARSSHSPQEPGTRSQPGLPPSRTEEQQIIREVGPSAPEDLAGSAHRNPYDFWIWGTAAVLVALGIFFLVAPVLYAEITPVLQSGPYYSPWFNYTMSAASPLIFVGVATAVAQLFVLSSRHARRRH
jgi:hypothetical protein